MGYRFKPLLFHLLFGYMLMENSRGWANSWVPGSTWETQKKLLASDFWLPPSATPSWLLVLAVLQVWFLRDGLEGIQVRSLQGCRGLRCDFYSYFVRRGPGKQIQKA